METQTLHDVPPNKVDKVVKGFEAEGYTVTKQLQANGNYTVVATRAAGAIKAVAAAEGDTVVLNNVPASSLSKVVNGLAAEGYTVTVLPEPDGEFTIIGVKS